MRVIQMYLHLVCVASLTHLGLVLRALFTYLGRIFWPTVLVCLCLEVCLYVCLFTHIWVSSVGLFLHI